MKKIGILTYHHACNYGANLQVLSTVECLRAKGYQPIIINWVPIDLEVYYKNTTPKEQYTEHQYFINNLLPLTTLCRTDNDVTKVIEDLDIEGIIVGSDAVVMHMPLGARIIFPTSRIITIIKPTSDRIYPNPFWGSYQAKLKKKIPMVMMSVSAQNADFKKIFPSERDKINKSISHYSMITVRDKWTMKMFEYLSNGSISPAVTPDPVFAFNYNVQTQRSKDEILAKYAIPEKYILFSFHDDKCVSRKWLSSIQVTATQNGYGCIAMPMPSGRKIHPGIMKEIMQPLNPLDWYGLIKYSSGYVGQNMHPIIVSLHNSVPFFCFDHYGINNFRIFPNHKSSKIYDILSEAGFLANRVFSSALNYQEPDSEIVFNKLMRFDREKCTNFSKLYYNKYMEMMKSIDNIFQ